MLLTINVGNTDTKLGCFDTGAELIAHWRVTTARRRTADEYGVLFHAFFSDLNLVPEGVEAIVVASVVPQIDRMLFEALRTYFKRTPIAFTAAVQTLLTIKTDRPLELGADLAAGAIAGYALARGAAIVINFGTATTFSAIDANGAFLGAAIAPGINLSIDALATQTAKLPQIALAAPPSPIGRDTVTALQAGIMYGTVGQIEGIVARMRAVIGPASVIATGGLAEIVAKETAVIERVEPYLVLLGLQRFYAAYRAGFA